MLLVLVLASRARASAQITCDIDCGEALAPRASIDPTTGVALEPSRNVTVHWSGTGGLVASTAQITVTVNGTPVSPQPTWTWTADTTVSGRVRAAHSSGTVSIPTNGAAVELTATICDAFNRCAQPATATWTYRAPPLVVPAVSSVSRPRDEALLESFRVINRNASAATYTLAGVCADPATVCSPGAAQVTVGPNDTAVVGVNYRLGSAGTQGSVGLSATEPQTGAQGFGSTTTTAASPADGPGSVGDRADLTLMERRMCVTVAVSAGSAYECGDLRLVHPLPTTRVLNTPRTPVLIYNSQQAWPTPVFAAHVARNAGMATRPDSLLAQVRIDGAVVATQKYRGITADVVRIAVAWNATARSTGVYGYTFEITGYYPGQPPQTDYTRAGRIAVVNRRYSAFGRGWWVAGVEQLLPINDSELLWVGGDGSTRVYGRIADGTGWAGPLFDRADTIRALPGGGWYRPVRGGATVLFDGVGNHVATANTLGDTTRFTWSGSLLTQITFPTGAAGTAVYAVTYDFSYGNGLLTEVSAPADDGSAARRRVVRVEMSGPDLKRIWDPELRGSVPPGTPLDLGKPHLRFLTTAARVSSRTNRANAGTSFRYDAAGRLSVTAQAAAPADSIRMSFRPAESQGLAAAVPEADVYTLINGPRTDTTVTRIVLDRWGAPVTITNALGASTVLRRGSARFPALVTSVRMLRAPGAPGTDPRENEVTATYDDRGNLLSTTDWRVQGADGRYSTTTYAYDARWDRATRVTGAEGQTVTTAYDAYGRPQWVQPGPDPARRVQFAYHPMRGQPGALYAGGRVSSISYPATATLAQAYELFEYDFLGNLAEIVSPRLYETYFDGNAIGQVIATRTQIDTTSSPGFQVDSAYYDVVGRVYRQVSAGPAMNGRPAQRVVLQTIYDDESRPTSVVRSAPDDSPMQITSAWKYDQAGRTLVAIAPDSTTGTLNDNPRDSTVFNAAGLPVWVRTRRGDVITTRYDALNRPLATYFPATVYAEQYQGIPSSPGGTPACAPADAQYNVFHAYPQFPNYQTCRYQVPGDSTTFVYDPLTGAVLHADNSDARITRTYTANGMLAGETQQIRTSDWTGDFTTHTYALGYQYDLAGRRRHLVHPAGISPHANPSTVYTYDGETGALASVADPVGNTFRYTYDARGQLTTLSAPGSVLHTYGYDQEGRVAQYLLDLPVSGGRVTQTRFSYDARDKLLRSQNEVGALDVFTGSYSGLGHLVSNHNSATGINAFGDMQTEVLGVNYTMDALGNVFSTATTTLTTTTNGTWLGGTSLSVDRKTTTSLYNPLTGAQDSLRQVAYRERYQYDRAGNTIFQAGVGGNWSDLAQYYSSDGRLRVVDRRNRFSFDEYRGVWEEYRYDALGRRVWVRTRHYCSNVTADRECPFNTVQRTVWDGDQALYEIRMQEVEAENDGTPQYTAPIGLVSPVTQTGRVLNTYGPGIDQPLSVIRLGYSGMFDFAAFPLWDPQGRAPYIVFPTGGRSLCYGGCLKTIWFLGQRAFGVRENGYVLRDDSYQDGVWLGNVMRDQRDGSGLLYRRNRYYNPQTGRFTQEDPIGLAGGMNAYGFADGDPVSFSDPFWLAVCFAGSRNHRANLEMLTELTIGGRIDVDRGTGCVTKVFPSQSSAVAQFKSLVDSEDTYTIAYGVGGSRFMPNRKTIFLDPSNTDTEFYTNEGGLCAMWGATAQFRSRILAHELGHAYMYNREWKWWNARASDKFHELGATGWENLWARQNHQPERCRYGVDDW